MDNTAKLSHHSFLLILGIILGYVGVTIAGWGARIGNNNLTILGGLITAIGLAFIGWGR